MAGHEGFEDLFGNPVIAEKKKRKGAGFSKFIVVFSILLALCYTCVALYFSWEGRHIPPELTVSFFSFIGVELGAVAWRTGKERVEQIKQGY